MVAGNESEYQPQASTEKVESGGGKLLPQELAVLLETVIQETIGTENRQSLDLVIRVARQSRFENGNSREAVEELVRAIVDHRFGAKKFSGRLVRSISTTLLESPEAVTRIAKLWGEARSS